MSSRIFRTRRPVWSLLVPIALLTLIACSSAQEAAPSPTAAAEPQQQTAPDLNSPGNLQIALATQDFGVGRNRLVFGIIDSKKGPLLNAKVEISTFRLSETGQEGPIETMIATYRKWPVSGGVYAIEVSFDRPGIWGIGAVVVEDDGMPRPASARLEIPESTSSVALGSPAPRSETKTMDSADSLDKITTDTSPDPDLYKMTVAEALDAGKPLVVTFSTPAYCQTATCGPQLAVVKDLKDKYGGRMNFIHVEVYDNPHEIQGNLSRGKISATLDEWGLLSEPWTFIIDSSGLVQHKFEAFTTKDELEEAIDDVL